MKKEKHYSRFEPSEESLQEYRLILFNDDVNDYTFVVDSLIEVCDHDPLQAEQCTMVTHFTGKCTIYSGKLKELQTMCTALTDRGLTAVVD